MHRASTTMHTFTMHIADERNRDKPLAQSDAARSHAITRDQSSRQLNDYSHLTRLSRLVSACVWADRSRAARVCVDGRFIFFVRDVGKW